MPQIVRRNAVSLLSGRCIPKSKIIKDFSHRRLGLKVKERSSYAEKQLAFADLFFGDLRKNPSFKAISDFLQKPVFKEIVRQALVKRMRSGATMAQKDGWELRDLSDALDFFSKKNRLKGSMRNRLEQIIKSEKLRQCLVNTIAKTVSHYSDRIRYRAMTKRTIEILQSLGLKNPVIIDYGTGTGEYSESFLSELKKAGINANIIATDRHVLPVASKLLRNSGVAFVEHDLSKSSFLGHYKKADVVRLGFVLPYNTRENAKKMIRNAMADLKTGGLLLYGLEYGGFVIYKKVSPTEIELIT